MYSAHAPWYASFPLQKIGALTARREDCSIRWIMPFLIPSLIAIAQPEDYS